MFIHISRDINEHHSTNILRFDVFRQCADSDKAFGSDNKSKRIRQSVGLRYQAQQQSASRNITVSFINTYLPSQNYASLYLIPLHSLSTGHISLFSFVTGSYVASSRLHPPTHPRTHPFIHSFVQSFIRSFTSKEIKLTPSDYYIQNRYFPTMRRLGHGLLLEAGTNQNVYVNPLVEDAKHNSN